MAEATLSCEQKAVPEHAREIKDGIDHVYNAALGCVCPDAAEAFALAGLSARSASKSVLIDPVRELKKAMKMLAEGVAAYNFLRATARQWRSGLHLLDLPRQTTQLLHIPAGLNQVSREAAGKDGWSPWAYRSMAPPHRREV
jgi:hypothetical protein